MLRDMYYYEGEKYNKHVEPLILNNKDDRKKMEYSLNEYEKNKESYLLSMSYCEKMINLQFIKNREIFTEIIVSSRKQDKDKESFDTDQTILNNTNNIKQFHKDKQINIHMKSIYEYYKKKYEESTLLLNKCEKEHKEKENSILTNSRKKFMEERQYLMYGYEEQVKLCIEQFHTHKSKLVQYMRDNSIDCEKVNKVREI